MSQRLLSTAQDKGACSCTDPAPGTPSGPGAVEPLLVQKMTQQGRRTFCLASGRDSAPVQDVRDESLLDSTTRRLLRRNTGRKATRLRAPTASSCGYQVSTRSVCGMTLSHMVVGRENN